MLAPRPLRRTLAVALTLLAACSARPPEAPATGGATAPPPEAVVVRIVPSSQRVLAGASVRFTASVAGTADPRVSWSVDPAGGTIDEDGVFTASATPGDYLVRATSVADGGAAGDATATVEAPAPPPPPIDVVLTAPAAPVDACRTLQLTARVENATDPALTWSVREGAAGGTVDATGLYRAPSTAGTYHVVATSAEDASRTAEVPVTVRVNVLSVAVSPETITLAPGQTALFTATVTTTCGSTATVSAPGRGAVSALTP